MKIKVLEKQDINSLLKDCLKEWDVYAPLKNQGGDVWLETLPREKKELDAALGNTVFSDCDTLISPKDIFFPQLEALFAFKDGQITESVESSKKLLFGIKACDLKGVLFADDFFRRNFQDKYYLSRTANRLLVVTGCLKPPRKSCFCSSAKTGPFAPEGFDLQLIDNQSAYLVEIGSQKGEAFANGFKKYFKDASRGVADEICAIKTKACAALELKVDFQKALELMGKKDFLPEENYKRIGERCIYCGACLYVCPTCTCFNVFDNKAGAKGERLRNWDACVFEGYTRETSGHNPRKEKWLRTLRRYEHKLKYDYQTTGTSGCVGCGRCLSSCPVDIGISKFIQEITQGKKVM